VATARVEEDELGDEQRQRLARGAMDLIRLGPLGREHLPALLASLFGSAAVSGRLVDQLYEITQGYPYLTLELCRALVDDGWATFEGGRWRLPRSLDAPGPGRPAQGEHPAVERTIRLPGTLEEALAGRLRRLSGDARSVAEVVAVHGAQAEASLLGVVTGLDEARLFGALDELAGRQVAHTQAGQVTLVHARLGEVLYAELPMERRQALHRRIGEALRELPADEAPGGTGTRQAETEVDPVRMRRIGHHLARGGPTVELEAVAWLQGFGDRAYEAGDSVEALEPLRLAATILERHGGPPAHPELLPIWERLGLCASVQDLELTADTYRLIRRHLGLADPSAPPSAARASAPDADGYQRYLAASVYLGIAQNLRGCLAEGREIAAELAAQAGGGPPGLEAAAQLLEARPAAH
jgi:predicted ATPase